MFLAPNIDEDGTMVTQRQVDVLGATRQAEYLPYFALSGKSNAVRCQHI